MQHAATVSRVRQEDERPLTDSDLQELERLCIEASPAPWVASVEGRDHTSGDSVILIGDPREDDMYVTRDSGMASAADLDFIAAARNALPRLLAEVRRQWGQDGRESSA
jgi:hypothetical protein